MHAMSGNLGGTARAVIWMLAALFMGESLNRGRWLSLVLGLVGVLIILRPGAAVVNPASLVMPIDYLRLPLITVVAWFLYSEVITLALAAGAALIIAGNAAGLYIESARIRRRTAGYPDD